MPKEPGKDGYYNYCDVLVNEGGPKKPKKRDAEDPRRKPFENEVIYWTNEEDPEAEAHKMFRPLYLLPKTYESGALTKL